MITPLSPLVKRKSFPQKLVELVENYVKKGINVLIKPFLNITKRFISFLKSVINRKFFWVLYWFIGRFCCYLSEQSITISPKSQDRPVIFCNPYRFFISIDNFRKKCNNRPYRMCLFAYGHSLLCSPQPAVVSYYSRFDSRRWF